MLYKIGVICLDFSYSLIMHYREYMETFGSTYAKALDDLSGKIFIPALISSLLVELGPYIGKTFNTGFISTYLCIFIIGIILSYTIIFLLFELSMRLAGGKSISAEVGVFIMPIGFVCLFPNHFSEIQLPLSQVTGVAVLAWSFMLVKNASFFTEILE